MVAVSLTTIMNTVKILSLLLVGPDLDAVLDYLEWFPCLERIYITVSIFARLLKMSSYHVAKLLASVLFSFVSS